MKRVYVYKLFLLAFRLSLIAILTGLFMGCESFVEVDLPDDQLYGESVFNEETTATAALNAIYAAYRDNTLLTGKIFGMSYLLGHYSDELTLYTLSLPDVEEFNSNAVLATNTLIENQWNNSYNLIYQANSILEQIEAGSQLENLVAQQLKGEALFNRALIHFYLMNLFGEIPYVRTSNYQENTNPTRLSEAEVIEELISDLEKSFSLLGESYNNLNRTRPNKWTCSALLAKVYLYAEDWEAASSEATQILKQTGLYTLEDDLDAVFLKDSRETLWQLSAANAGGNTIEATNFIFVQTPPPDSALSENLLNAFEAGDERATSWIGYLSDGNTTYAYPNKYKENTNTGTSVELSIVTRLAEVYLIRAEAQARLNNTTLALQDLNQIRRRGGLADLKATAGLKLLDAILVERQRELFTEHGHRFLDLKRIGKVDEVLGTLKNGWESTDRVLPIPQNELEINPNLQPQNPGY